MRSLHSWRVRVTVCQGCWQVSVDIMRCLAIWGGCITSLRFPSYLVWSGCKIGGLRTLCGLCIQDLWSLNSECEFPELFRGLCQCVRFIGWLDSLFLTALNWLAVFQGVRSLAAWEFIFLVYGL